MKVFFFFLTSIILSASIGYAQGIEKLSNEKYRVFYRLTCVKDSANLESKHSEPMLLQVGESVSKFMSYRNYLQDSTLIATGQRDLSIPHTKFYFRLYKNHPESKVTFRDQIMMLVHLEYEVENTALNWNILPERKNVAGYTCQKATTHFAGRDYIAWFTTEIPLQDAPYKFDGLPGFIIKVQDTKKHYIFDFLRIERSHVNPERCIFKRKAPHRQVTRAEFLEKQQGIQKRSMDSVLAEQGLTIHFEDEETSKNVQKNVRAFSNYIELE